MLQINSRSAIRHLKRVDPKLAAVIESVGPCKFKASEDGDHFEHIAEAIVYQQLSGKAAATIYSRFESLYGGHTPTPRELLQTPDEKLRAVGLSRQKLSYLKDLANKVVSEEVPVHRLHEFEDHEIIERLTLVKGIGRWTAQMFLIFRLGRPNVLPDLDLGIQKAIMKAYGLRKLPKPKDVLRVGARWQPHCTIACWYLWRSLDEAKD